MAENLCEHLSRIGTLKLARRTECEDCGRPGATWVSLRTCQSCGGTRCCDSSPNQHATRHWKSSSHPVVSSAEPEERWLYCYPDETTVEY